jgi:uncharacterized protein (TIGR02186 family)
MIRRLLLLLAILALGTPARGQSLTADLSSHIIGITTGFVGANLTLFGTVDKAGDVVVIVRGPPTDIVVRRKHRVLGMWINGSSAVFHDAPSFYSTASSRPFSDLGMTPDTLARHMIGLDNVKLQTADPVAEPAFSEFRAALVEAQERLDLYRATPVPVTFLGEHLFRADMAFPANVPTGTYSVQIVLLSGGEVIGAQTSSLIVSRIGFSNGVFNAAQHHAALYGLGALVLAVTAGWAASLVFRRG